MPQIYELLGYPVDDDSPVVQASRKAAICPFISDKCDGGGNRYMSDIDLSKNDDLAAMFPGMTRVPSGVCSIQLHNGSSPWIICPRRLLYLGKKANENILSGSTQTDLIRRCKFNKGDLIGIWSEVKVKFSSIDTDDNAEFDYTFDYILMPLKRISISDAENITGIEKTKLIKMLSDNGHTFSKRDGLDFIEDFPIGKPIIVEVMASSTSGGNKKKRSCIPQAFEDCMLRRQHTAPGINYRQVWARMASQLIVKSQAAIAWDGIAIWVLQDLLADYISSSTALDLNKFISKNTNEVNILAFSYAEKYKNTKKGEPVNLDSSTLYSGPIKSGSENNIQPCFQDIVLASVCPPKQFLSTALCKKAFANRIIIK